MIDADQILIAGRAVFGAAALFLWGSGIYIATLVPGPLRPEIWSGLRRVRLLAAFALAAAALAALPAQAARLGDGWTAVANWNLVSAMLLSTGIGTAVMAQGLAGLIMLAAVTCRARLQPAATALCAAAALAAMALSGHAAMETGPAKILHQANDVMHVLAGGFWLGGLPVFLLIMARRRLALGHADATRALMRFSIAGHLAVALVLVTGAANTWFVVGGLPDDFSLAYQRLLVIKIALVAAMVCIALTNRYVLVPLLRSRPAADTALMLATGLEIVLGTAVVCLVAWFGTLPPT